MSGPPESNGRVDSPPEGSGVLANLPKTRPQRSSPRRTAARGKSATATTASATAGSNAQASPARPTKPTKPAAKPRRTKARPTGPSTKKTAARTPLVKTSRQTTVRPKASRKELPAVPRQGYASEGDRATGAVQAPGGTELVGSAAEIIGELAKVGISTGERLLRDVFSRLPGI